MRIIDADALTLMDIHLIDGKFLCDAPTVNAIPIPENATNGDMIKALFPNYQHAIIGAVQNTEWWNAPYEHIGGKE